MNAEEIKKQFEVKENLIVEGITEDYVWYHAKKLLNQMEIWKHEFEKVVKVMENRHSEHLKIINDLLIEKDALKRKAKKDE